MESTAETWELCSTNWKLRRGLSDCMLLDHCLEQPDNRWSTISVIMHPLTVTSPDRASIVCLAKWFMNIRMDQHQHWQFVILILVFPLWSLHATAAAFCSVAYSVLVTFHIKAQSGIQLLSNHCIWQQWWLLLVRGTGMAYKVVSRPLTILLRVAVSSGQSLNPSLKSLGSHCMKFHTDIHGPSVAEY